MQKNLTIALNIILKNSQQVSRELENAGKKIKPIKVRLEADSPVLQDGKVRLDGDFNQVGEKIGTSASAQISEGIKAVVSQTPLRISDADADRVAKKFTNSISDGIKDSLDGALSKLGRGNILGAIGSVATAPLRVAANVAGTAFSIPGAVLGQITRGISDGITDELVRGLGTGIRQSVEQKLSGAIGSSELFGKTIADKFARQVTVLETALNKVSPLSGTVIEVIKSEFKRLISTAFDEREVLAEGLAAQRRARKQRSATQSEAAEEANVERQRATRSAADFREDLPRRKTELIVQREELSGRKDEFQATARQIESLQQQSAAAPENQRAEIEAEIAQLVARNNRILADFEAIDQELRKLELAQAGYVTQLKTANRNVDLLNDPRQARAIVSEELRATEAKGQRLRDFIGENQIEGDRLRAAIAEQTQQAKSLFGKERTPEYDRASAELGRSQIALRQNEADLKALGELRQELEQRASSLRKQLEQLPEGLPPVVAEIYRGLIGSVPKGDQVPAIKERTSATLGTANANFAPEQNAINLRPELFKAVQEARELGDLSIEQLNILTEEIAHSLQVNFGNLESISRDYLKNFQRVASDAEDSELLKLAPELRQYRPETRAIEQDAKVARDRFIAQERRRREADAAIAGLNENFGVGGPEFSLELDRSLVAAKKQIEELQRQAQELGQVESPALGALNRFFGETVQLAGSVSSRLAKTLQEPLLSPEKAQELVADVQKTVSYVDQLDELIARTEARIKTPPKPRQEEPGALTRAGEIATGLSEKLEPAGGIILRSAEFAGDALGAVGRAGLALADRIGLAASSLIPGGALLYEPVLKPAAKTAAVGGALAAASATVPGAAEILGTITSTLSAILSPATSGLATTVGAEVAAQISGALPQLFQSLSGTIASSGLPGAEFTAQAVGAIGGQLAHLLEPVVSGVASTADASIVAVGSAVNQFLGELGTILLAGKTVEAGARLATSKDAREAALQGIQVVGEGVDQLVSAVPDAIDSIQEAVDRTTRAVQRNVEEIKDAGQRLAQGETQAIGEITEAGTQAASNIARGASDIATASTKAANEIVEGAAKVGGVFGRLESIPGVNDLGELSRGQLLSVYNQLTKKLENVLKAEVEAIEKTGSAGTGRSGVIRGDLNRVADVLQEKYQHTIDVVAEEVREDIQGEPLQLPAKINLPELQPIEVQPQQPQEEPLKLQLDTPQVVARQVSEQNIEVEEPQIVVDLPSIEVEPKRTEVATGRRKPTSQADQERLNGAIAAVDAEFAASREEIRKLRDQLYGYVDAAIKAQKAIKKATQKGDAVEVGNAEAAFREATDEANRYGSQLTARAREIYAEIQNSRKLLQEYGVDFSQNSELGRALDGYKQSLTKTISGAESRLKKIGIDLSAEPVNKSTLQQLPTGIDEISSVLREKAKSLASALQNLVEVARQNPRIVNTAKDLAVNTAGFVASQVVADHGTVAQLAADLIAALAARNTIALASGQDAPERGLIEAIQRLTARLSDPKFQDGVGKEIFGDILGFITGNITNQITGIPGSGAVAAAAIVPRVQQFRDRQNTPLTGDALESRDPEIEQALEDLRRVAEAAGRVDATAGDRIALFFLGLKQAFSQAPDDRDIAKLRKATESLETLLANETAQQISQIPSEIEQAIQQSETQLDRLDRERLQPNPTPKVEDPNVAAYLAKQAEQVALDQEEARLLIEREIQQAQAETLSERLERLNQLQAQEQDSLGDRLEGIAKERAATQDAFAERIRQQQELGEQERVQQPLPTKPESTKSVNNQLSEAAAQRQVDAPLIQVEREPGLGDRLQQIQQEQQSLTDRLAGLQRLSQQEQEAHNQRIANAAREREIESEAFSEKLRHEQQLGEAERNRSQERQRATKEEREAVDRLLSEAAAQKLQPEALSTRLTQIKPESGLDDRLAEIAREREAREEVINQRIADAKRAGEEERQQATETLKATIQALGENRAKRQEVDSSLTDGLVPRITVDVSDRQRSQATYQQQERAATNRVINNRLRSSTPPTESLEAINAAADQAYIKFEEARNRFDRAATNLEDRFAESGRKIGSQQNIFERIANAYRHTIDRIQEAGGGGSGGDPGGGFFAALSSGAEQAKGKLLDLGGRIGLPIGAFGKLASAAKYALIGLLAYAGVSTIGDALFTLGRRAFEVATQFERLQTRVSFTNNGNLEATQRDIDFIQSEAERIKKPVNEILNAYAQLRVSAKNTPLEGAVTDQVFQSLNTLSRTLNFTADQVEGAQVQLGQVFRIGRADTEDLKTIAERGIPAFEKLGKVLGMPLDAVQKKIEAGEVSAQKLAQAFILAGKEAEGGLAGALKTSSAALDEFKRVSEQALLGFGQFVTPAVVTTLAAGGQAIEFLSEAGARLKPVLDAAGEVINFVAVALSPLTALVGQLLSLGLLELLTGLAIPFQAIAAGLSVLSAELQKIYQFFAPAIGAIADFIGSTGIAQVAVRTLGEVLGIFLITKAIALAATITSAVIPALVGMATTMLAQVVPAVVVATRAALAFIATPIGATIAAIGLAAAIAIPNIDKLANALSGVDVKGNERAIDFNREYNEGLAKLSKNIPLTEEELQKLKDGFAESVRTGRDSAKVAENLTNRLQQLQDEAKNAAIAQQALSKAFESSSRAFEQSQKSLEDEKLGSEIKRSQALLNSQLSIKDAKESAQREEIQDEQSYGEDLISLYERRNTEIAGLLAQNQALLAGGGLTSDEQQKRQQAVEAAQKEQVENLSKLKQAQLSILKSEQQERERIEQNRVQRVENSQKIIENQVAAGVKRQVEGEIEISDSKQSEISRRIKDIDRALAAEIAASGKASDLAKQLYSERAVLSSEYTKLEAEESDKRYEAFAADVDRMRDKLADGISLSEAETSRDIQKALLAGLDPEEGERRKIQATKIRFQQELALELSKAQQLASAPTPATEDKRLEQEKTLRDSKIKSAQLTGQLAEEEQKAQKALRDANLKAIEEETRGLELQSKGLDDRARSVEDFGKKADLVNSIVTRSYERQNALLEKQKNLQDALSAYAADQYKILEETADSEKEKAKIQERAAKARLDALRESQRIERQVLELQLQQEEAQQRIAIARAASEVQKAQLESDRAAIEVEKAQLERDKLDENPQATENEKRLADKNIESAQLAQQSSRLVEQTAESSLAGEFERLQLKREEAASKRQQAAISRSRDLLNARLELAKSRTDPDQRERELNLLERQARRDTRERERDTRERETGLRDRTRRGEEFDREVVSGRREIKTYAPDLTKLLDKGGINLPGVRLPERPTITPVDLHSGVQVNLEGLMDAIDRIDNAPLQRRLDDLIRIESQLSTQIQGLANRRQITQHNNTTNVVQRTPAIVSGVPN